MLVSVVIAAYNGERFILRQLESIKKQTRQVDEVIICDDRSTDNTVSLVCDFISKNSLENWNIYINEKNVGYCFNFYGAIERAKGDIIFLSDQDDMWAENKVERMCEVFESEPDIYSLACRYDVIDAEDNKIKNADIPYLGERFDGSIEPQSVDSFIGCSHIRGFSMAFRSAVKEYLKPLDLTSLLAHDWYINLISAALGKACVLNEKLGFYRWHDSNVSLSGMSRQTLIGDREKRKRGLRESIIAHRTVAEDFAQKYNENDIKNLLRQARLEELRLRLLESKNPFLIFSLLRFKDSYARYYKFSPWYRVFIGDICYTYNINLKKPKAR